MADPTARRFHAYRLSPTTARRFKQRPDPYRVSERRRRAIQMREGGMPTLQVGLQLAADPAKNPTGLSVPSGYGWWLYQNGRPPLTDRGYEAAVRRDVAWGTKIAHENLVAESEQEFQMSLRRMDRMLQAIWPEVLAGSQWHVFRALQIEERRAKMWGWDTEKRIVDGSGGGQKAIGAAAEPAYTREYVGEMFGVLLSSGLVSGEEVAVLTGQFQEQGAVAVDADVIDGEVVEDEVASG